MTTKQKLNQRITVFFKNKIEDELTSQVWPVPHWKVGSVKIDIFEGSYIKSVRPVRIDIRREFGS